MHKEEKMQTRNLSELVLYQIQKLILNKEFRPGSLLPAEKDLAERFGVGKSSVREAIKMLHILGVVESKQGVGTFVRESVSSNVMMPMLMELTLQQSTSEDLLEFRAMFETAYSVIAIQKATEEDIESLARQHARFLEKIEDGTVTAEDDIAFHKSILRITRNSFTMKIGNTVYEVLRPSIEYSIKYFTENTKHNHSQIMRAFENRDAAIMQAAMDGVYDTFYLAMSAMRNAPGEDTEPIHEQSDKNMEPFQEKQGQ